MSELDQPKKFNYKARDQRGKIINGTVQANSSADVTRELVRGGLVPLEIKGGGGVSLRGEFEIRKTAKPRDLVLATRQMAAMLDSGLNYIEAIDVVRGDCQDIVLKNALSEVRYQVQNGSSLAVAMENQGRVFPPMVINLIMAGETAGRVKEAMNQVADQLDASDRLRAKVKKAMMYPVILAVISGIIFTGMMLFLVPKFIQAFKDLGTNVELPKLTQIVVAGSDLMKVGLIPSIIALVVIIFVYKSNAHRPAVREVMDPLKLRLPVFGKLFHKIALARMTRDLSGLLNAGVERLEALEITAKTCGNIRMERALLAAREAQREGRPLVAPLREEPLFPPMLLQMVDAGERSGRTPFMLEKAAAIYDRDVDQITDNLAALIEPIFIAMLGVMIGVLVIAIYLPYLSIGKALSG